MRVFLYVKINLVPRALFPGFGGGAPRLQSQGKEPWGRGCVKIFQVSLNFK